MRKFYYFVWSLLLMIAAVSCKDDHVDPVETPVEEVKISVQPMFGNEVLYLDSTYTTPEGYDVQFTELKFYMGTPSNNGKQMIDAGLFDYRQSGTFLLKTEGKATDFSSLSAFLGIDSGLNHNDPSAFPNESMLNIAHANDMHWGWNPGYIFMKVEAKVDTIPDGNPLFDHLVVFHIGKDENLQSLSFPGITWSDQGDVSELSLKLDMLAFLQNGSSTIDLKNEYTSHTAPGQEILSLKVITNFASAISPL